MTETPELERGLGRRALLRNTLIAGAGVAALGAMSIPLAGTAGAVTYQVDWAWCYHCNALFWATATFENNGLCPGNGGGPHLVGETNYTAMYGVGTSGNPGDTRSYGQQAGWAYCSKCKIVGLRSNPGVCMWNSTYVLGELRAPSKHTYGSTNYAVPFGNSGDEYQNGWVNCYNCAILYYGHGWGNAAENCAATAFNGQHTPANAWHYQAIFT
jgi:hypothetical protein